MKRIPEFTCGLIGSILGTIIASITCLIMGFRPAIEEWSSIAWQTNGLGTFIGITAIVFACLINSKTKASSIVLIIASILLFLTNFFQLIPSILLLIAGIMGLSRKVS